MFRFEVHVRITDETGQHIQHMGAAAKPSETFLFSSLFDGDNGVMVGGSNPLSNFCADADDLCCGLVDDFVSRTSGKEDGLFLGHQSTWKMGFPGDWNIFVSSGDGSGSNEPSFKQDGMREGVHKADSSEEERSPHWSSEEDQNMVEFDSDESKALWESLSKSSDPYNPFFFSACISTNANMGKSEGEMSDADLMAVSAAGKEMLGPRGLGIWVSRSDSESSWASSDSSSPDVDKEESERLWDLFSSPADPYNPLCFSACTITHAAPPASSDPDDRDGGFPPSSEDDEEEQLWRSLCQKDDPFHPLNFRACLTSLSTAAALPHVPDVQHQTDPPTSSETCDKKAKRSRPTKPSLPERKLKRHSHPDKTLVPWRRPGQSPQPAPQETEDRKTSSTKKKVIV